MMEDKNVKCSICGQPIKTVTGSISGSGQHLTCRRCFGESSYSGNSQWGHNPMSGGQANSG